MYKKAFPGFPADLRQDRSPFGARSVLPVREHGKTATMYVRAEEAKPENAAGGVFQHSHRSQCRSAWGAYYASFPTLSLGMKNDLAHFLFESIMFAGVWLNPDSAVEMESLDAEWL